MNKYPSVFRLQYYSDNLWLFVVLYMLIVVSFAIVYSAISDNFYCTTIQYEPAVFGFEYNVATSLSNDIERNYKLDDDMPSPGSQVNSIVVLIDKISLKNGHVVAKSNVYLSSKKTT